LKIQLHVFGNEKTEPKRRIHRVFEIMECARKISDAKRIGRRSERFFPAQNVDRRFREDLVDVKKIWTAEHVERDRNSLARFRKILRFPVVQLDKLLRV